MGRTEGQRMTKEGWMPRHFRHWRMCSQEWGICQDSSLLNYLYKLIFAWWFIDSNGKHNIGRYPGKWCSLFKKRNFMQVRAFKKLKFYLLCIYAIQCHHFNVHWRKSHFNLHHHLLNGRESSNIHTHPPVWQYQDSRSGSEQLKHNHLYHPSADFLPVECKAAA